MKKFTGFGSGMSSYQYSAKKTVWKWTPAKIAAFSMFGIMMAALVYFESTSSRSDFEPVLIPENANPISSTTDFEKEYQEFLKKGRKIVSQETLDSLNAIQAPSQLEATANTSSLTTAVEAERANENQPEVNHSQPTKTETVTSGGFNVAKNPNSAPVENVENSIESVEQLPTKRKEPAIDQSQSITGKLEEANPADYDTPSNNPVRRTEPDQAITEEFYIEETISGKVSALADGSPIAGVEISVKGTGVSAISDTDGSYTITVPGDPEHRTIRYVYHGNATERDVAPGTNILNIRF